MILRQTRYSARWVLPVTEAPVANGAVLVEDGRIAAVGPRDGVPLPAGAADIDLGDAALLPGLVDAHVHLELSYLRGMIEDVSFPDWIGRLRRIKLALAPADADIRTAARWTCVEAIRAGITTVAATEDSEAGMDALVESGLRAVLYREVFGPAPDQCDDAMAGLRAQIDRLRARETDLVRAGVSPHAPYTVSDALYRAVARYAAEASLPMATHIAESADEHDLVVHGRGVFAGRLLARGIAVSPRARSPIELLERTGVLGRAPLLIHCVNVDENDAALIATSGAAVVHCPAANARLAHGIAPVTLLRDAGVTVVLGSDSVASNNRIDMLEEARLAQMLQRVRTGRPDALPAAALLRAATLDGARALGLEDRIGSLEPGKDADLCAVSLAASHIRPVHDPLAALFLAARAGDVILTAVRGRILQRDGRITTIQVDAAAASIDALAARARIAAGMPSHHPAAVPAPG